MHVKWLGLASFLITSDKGIKILTDPYETGGELSYGRITEQADIVTVSHEHFDHNNVATVQGNPTVLRAVGPAQIRGIPFVGIASLHDDVGGMDRGKNTIFRFEVDGLKVCHLGDLGHQLSDEQSNKIGSVDVLLIPVGGVFTINAKLATELCDLLKPKVVIPMHYRDGKCNFPIDGVDEFLKSKSNVSRLDTSEVELRREKLPVSTQIIVLKSAL